MMLFVDAINQGVSCTSVGYWVENHEAAFERLTGLVNQDWTLLSALICEGNDCFSVPVEAFDGQPIDVHVRSLQEQWQRLLVNQPQPSTGFTNPQLWDWLTKLNAYYEAQLTHLQKMIFCLEIRQIQSNRHRNESFRLRLNRQYDALLASNRRMLRTTKENYQRNQQRLDDLKGHLNP